MPEMEPKITLQVITFIDAWGYPAKHRKWSRKEDLAKNNFVLELFTKDVTICLTRVQIPSNF